MRIRLQKKYAQTLADRKQKLALHTPYSRPDDKARNTIEIVTNTLKIQPKILIVKANRKLETTHCILHANHS